MDHLTNYPLALFAMAFAVMALASAAGVWLRRADARAGRTRSADLDTISAATLSLLALIIAFTFSMAGARYDQRKVLEENEANAIGTEILRVRLLPPPDAAAARSLLGAYLDQRIAFFANDGGAGRAQINRRTDQLEDRMWTAVSAPAAAGPPRSGRLCSAA